MTQRASRLVLVLGALLSDPPLCLGGIQIPAAPIGGPFRLVDQDGRTVSEQDLKGKPFLVFFGFTHCPEICPTTLFDVSEIMRSLGRDADRTAALFITVDPERDA